MSLLEELIGKLQDLEPGQKADLVDQAVVATSKLHFIPWPGPQTNAYISQADEMFYGGAAGGGKSALLVGLAVQEHQRSIIFRREYSQIKGLEDEAQRILGSRTGYNAAEKVWKHSDGRILEFGSVPHEHDKERFQGRPHSFIGFDEITHFSESQYRYLIGWNRSAIGERCRIMATGNPPHTAAGSWVIRYWAPWLDPTHPNPAKAGELRWFTTINGEDVELEGSDPVVIDGRLVQPRSRTFVPAKLEDNPALMDSGYAAVLEAMPEPLRTMMREGRFDVAARDDDFQVIPTAWIDAAQRRWTNVKPATPMTALGVDVAQGGDDETTISPRYGTWFDELVTRKGIDTKDGPAVAGLIVQVLRDGALVNIDTGGGWGGSAFDHLKHQNVAIQGITGAKASMARTRDKQLSFINLRAETWWKLREALDPAYGSNLALPPDTMLKADLTAPRWKLTPRGIQIEAKEEIRKRIGRSPDRGDAVVLSWCSGDKQGAAAQMNNTPFQAKAKLGYSSVKKNTRR